ncbi:MAG: hypothetical protein HQK94_19470 [Nitrospirae bacterium]|nr:hypothetical protein [Nitrospirota bacterium]
MGYQDGLDDGALDTDILKGLRLSMETTNALLKDQVDIPPDEQWLFDNPEALAMVLKGLEDSANGRIVKVNIDEL